jgi:hypothetical protein
MARIIGAPGCTTELLAELRRRGLRDLNSFTDVERFHSSRDTIIAEERARAEQLLLAQVFELRATAAALDEDIGRRATERRAELAAELARLPVDLASLAASSARTPLAGIRKWIRCLKLRLRLRTLIRHFEREALRPFRADTRQAQDHRERAVQIESQIPQSLEMAVAPLVEAKRCLEGDGRGFFLGPDEFTVFSDVIFVLPKAHRWKEHGEWVQRAQVDHVVVGDDCVYLLEVKNWSSYSLQAATFTPQHQVKRANHIVYCLAKERFGGRKLHIRNLVVMCRDSTERWERFPPPYEYVTKVPAGRLLEYFSATRPRGSGSVTTAEACDWIEWFVS